MIFVWVTIFKYNSGRTRRIEIRTSASASFALHERCVLTAERLFLAGLEEELGAYQGRDILSHFLALYQRRAVVRVIAHRGAAQAVVALAGEALAPQEAGIVRALVRDVLALGVDALDE